jgi:predicted ATPase
MSKHNDESKRSLILTDDIEINPILDFDLYTNTIFKIIENSYPKFTIGIFGDWGTGKTTLMNSVYNMLNDKNIIKVHF